MKLLLVRHGNTFSPSDKVVWVGGDQDLPLVEEGRRQAERFGQALARLDRPSAVYSSPLKRTREFAEIALVSAGLDMPVNFEEALMELDYGLWSGLSDREIKEKFGERCLADWVERSIFPEGCQWAGTARSVEEEIRVFVDRLLTTHGQDASVLIVSSNGRLRFFLKLVAGEFESRVTAGSFKVGTGQSCLLEIGQGGNRVIMWNQPPDALLSTATTLLP